MLREKESSGDVGLLLVLHCSMWNYRSVSVRAACLTTESEEELSWKQQHRDTTETPACERCRDKHCREGEEASSLLAGVRVYKRDSDVGCCCFVLSFPLFESLRYFFFLTYYSLHRNMASFQTSYSDMFSS